MARLDPYDKDNIERIIKLLKDENEWVRLNAAGALTYFGKKARLAIPALKECAKTGNEILGKRIEKSIRAIENAQDKTRLEKQHKKLLREIDNFVKALKKQKD